MKFTYKRMIDLFQYDSFCFSIFNLFFYLQIIFVNNLHCINLPIRTLTNQQHLPKISPANRLDQFEVCNIDFMSIIGEDNTLLIESDSFCLMFIKWFRISINLLRNNILMVFLILFKAIETLSHMYYIKYF